MKRKQNKTKLSFITLCLLSLGATALAQNPVQTVSYSGTEYYKHSKKEYAKIWMQADPGNLKSRSERKDEKTGEVSIMIFRQDSAKMYVLKPEKKTWMAISMSQLNMNDLVGLNVEKDRNVEKKFLGLEDVNGYECHHYQHISTSTLNNGTQETGCTHSWMYEPLNVQMQYSNCGYDEPIYLGNFKQGPQPAHLFELPDDYTGMSLPVGGLMEMLTGKPREQNQQDVDETKKNLQEGMQNINDQIKEIENDPNKSEQEKIMDALKMLGGSKKK